MTRASFLDKNPADLEAFLLQLARQDVAPREARERALRNVAAAASVGLVSAASSSGAGIPLKMTGWLAGKYLAVGLAAGFLSVGAADVVSQIASDSKTLPAARHPAAAKPAKSGPANVGATRRSADARENVAPAQPTAEPPEASTVPPPPPALLPPPGIVNLPAQPPSAGAAAPRATTSGSSPAASSPGASSLGRELDVLESARRALAAGAPSQASAALDQYAAEFPNGSLRVEAAALRIEAVGQSGNATRARELADAFLSAYPTSPLAERVRAARQTFRREVQKP